MSLSADSPNVLAYLSDISGVQAKMRILGSVKNILDKYNLSVSQINLSRKKFSAQDLLVAAEEECNLEIAEALLITKYRNKIPPPITVVQWRHKKVIYLGSNRSIVYTLKRRKIDSLVVKLPVDITNTTLFSRANLTLNQIINNQK